MKLENGGPLTTMTSGRQSKVAPTPTWKAFRAHGIDGSGRLKTDLPISETSSDARPCEPGLAGRTLIAVLASEALPRSVAKAHVTWPSWCGIRWTATPSCLVAGSVDASDAPPAITRTSWPPATRYSAKEVVLAAPIALLGAKWYVKRRTLISTSIPLALSCAEEGQQTSATAHYRLSAALQDSVSVRALPRTR